MKEVTEFTIDRAVWLRGEGADLSRLLRCEDSKQCCLGIYLEACGVPRAELKGVRGPSTLRSRRTHIPSWLMNGETTVSSHLMFDNDSPHLSDNEREARIASEFAAAGITVRFVGVTR